MKGFGKHFATYSAAVLASGLIRMLVGDIRVDGLADAASAFFAWALIYLPLAALAAWYLSTRKPEPDIPRKPRIVKSVLIGLAIPGALLGLALVLQ